MAMAMRRRLLAIVSASAAAYLAGDVIHWLRVDNSVPRENIVSEAIARRALSPGANVDVSDIAEKYIAVGEDRKAVVRYLTALGFEIHFQLLEIDGIEALIATRSPLERTFGNYSPIPFPFFDKLEVTVYFDGQLVKSTSGQLIYRAS